MFRAKVGEAEEVKQCGLAGGLPAVVDSEAVLQELVGAAAGLEAECGLRYRSGYTDRQEEGVWVQHLTGAALAWVDWEQNQPDNYGGDEHCSEVILETGKTNDDKCSKGPCKTTMDFQIQRS